MVLIRATCNDCGDVDLRPSSVTARRCTTDGGATYRFHCPVCRMVEIREADDRIQGLLALAGVKREEWRLPLELWERPPAGKPINHDDLIDFHIALGGLPEACPERRADPPRSRGVPRIWVFLKKVCGQ